MSSANPPYPQVRVQEPNPAYAKEILGNIGGRDSEITAVTLYFYDHLVTRENPELSKLFHQVSVTEMRHLELFGEMALQLGADPRLWERVGRVKRYWSPKYIPYAVKPRKIITNALISEHMALEKYTKQAKTIRDEGIVECLNRIILDEKEHIRLFTQWLKRL